MLLKRGAGPPTHRGPSPFGQARRTQNPACCLRCFESLSESAFSRCCSQSGGPWTLKMVSQALFWSQFGSKLAIVAPCENLIIYYVFLAKPHFGTGRVLNNTLTCVQGASEIVFCTFFCPLWRPRGAPGLKTELLECPMASQKGH